MEQDVFLRPAVAGILESKFVEARLHVDIPRDLSDAQLQENRAVRDRLVDTAAMPTYVIVDPATGEKLVTTGLSGTLASWEQLFLDFLAQGQKSAGQGE